jgi:hypothetical protein
MLLLLLARIGLAAEIVFIIHSQGARLRVTTRFSGISLSICPRRGALGQVVVLGLRGADQQPGRAKSRSGHGTQNLHDIYAV